MPEIETSVRPLDSRPPHTAGRRSRSRAADDGRSYRFGPVDVSRLTRGFDFRQAMLLTTGCFVLIALGVGAISLVARDYAQQCTRQTQTLTNEFLPGLVTLARLQDAALNLKSMTLQFALTRDEAAVNAQKDAFENDLTQVTRCVADLRRLSPDPETLKEIASFSATVQSYRDTVDAFRAELRAGEFKKAMATLDQQLDPAQDKIELQLRTLGERYFQLSRDASARTTALLAQADRFGLLATLVLGAFTLLCLPLSLAATRALLAQIGKRDSERENARATLERRVEARTADLRKSEERIRLIVDTASDAIITFDADGVISDWNAQAEKTFGWTRAEAVGRLLADTVIVPARRNLHQERVRRFLATGNSTELQLRVETSGLHRDGQELPVEVTVSPIIFQQQIARAPAASELAGATHPIAKETVLFSAFVRDITERKRAEEELKQMHRQLLETSRHAGMAEVATGVLHNVGNALNSVNVSATVVTDQLARSKTANLTKIAAMLQEQNGSVVPFLTEDPKGRRIPAYIISLASELATEQRQAVAELEDLRKNIDHIKDIVAMQQNYAKVSGVPEDVAVSALMEDAVRMNASALMRHGLDVIREYQVDPTITIERHKVLQVLVNLIRNAKYACDESGRSDKRLILRITPNGDRIQFSVIDNGIGIPPENLTRIFAHGFTTRKDGHGFGLHSSALVAKELGGSLVARSAGRGEGAAFTLEIPLTSVSS